MAASEEIVCYYMDPRNFLNDTYIFQFLNHNYDSAHQTKEGLQSMVTGTFLEKSVASGGVSETPIDQSAGPGAFASESDNHYGPGSPYAPDASNQNTNNSGPGATGGPGVSSSNQNANSGGPGSTQQTVPAETEAPSSGIQSSGVQFVSPSGNSQGNVSLEGPSAVVSARKTNVLAVPADAVHRAGSGEFVYVVGDSGLREFKWIETGLHGKDYVEVFSGLAEGEKVVLK